MDLPKKSRGENQTRRVSKGGEKTSDKRRRRHQKESTMQNGKISRFCRKKRREGKKASPVKETPDDRTECPQGAPLRKIFTASPEKKKRITISEKKEGAGNERERRPLSYCGKGEEKGHAISQKGANTGISVPQPEQVGEKRGIFLRYGAQGRSWGDPSRKAMCRGPILHLFVKRTARSYMERGAAPMRGGQVSLVGGRKESRRSRKRGNCHLSPAKNIALEEKGRSRHR